MICKPDSSDNTKAICEGIIYEEGEYYLTVNGTKFEDITVTVKEVPSLISYSPISFSPSLNSQTIILYSEDNISSYVDKNTFVGAETLTSKCELSSNYVLNCSAVFKNEDKYFITMNDANIGSFINVNESITNKCKNDRMQCNICICPRGRELIKDECKVESCRNGKNMNGRCNCKSGYTFKNGECKSNIKCEGGRIVRRKCVCPKGKKLQNGKCVVIGIKCQGGSIRYGRCVCPRGKTLKNGVCVNKKIKCIGGHVYGGRCKCPRGTKLVKGECKKQ